MMKNKLLIFLLIFAGCPVFGQPAEIRKASLSILTPENYIWNWRDAVLLEANIQLYRSNRDSFKEVPGLVFDLMGKYVTTCSGRHPNAIASGVGFAFLWTEGLATREMKDSAKKIYDQYKHILRTPSGACSHRHNRIELWDDTLYMVGIFLLEMYRATGDPKYLQDCVNEILLHADVLRDDTTGLWYHGWSASQVPSDDECGEYGWNTNSLQRNNEFWGRGNGWIAMILADVLEILPSDHKDKHSVETMFKQMMNTLKKCQDRKTGLWRQLPVRTHDKENFLESSCTAMFGYAMAKGARLGILDSPFKKYAKNACNGLCSFCIDGLGTPAVTLGRICEGTCVGSRDYYYSRKTISGDSYAVGAFIMLANETNNI